MTDGGDAPPIRYGKDNHKSISVYLYDLKGNFVAEYESSRQAALSLNNNNYEHIGECCNFKRKTAFGYIWRFFKQDKIEVLKKKWDRITFSKLIAYNDLEIHEFSSMKEAYEFLGVTNKGKINSVLKGEKQMYKGYYWKIEP